MKTRGFSRPQSLIGARRRAVEGHGVAVHLDLGLWSKGRSTLLYLNKKTEIREKCAMLRSDGLDSAWKSVWRVRGAWAGVGRAKKLGNPHWVTPTQDRTADLSRPQ